MLLPHYEIRLSTAEQQALETLQRAGKTSQQTVRRVSILLLAHEGLSNQPVMRLSLTLSDEKKTVEGYTTSGSGVTEVERPWCLQPVYQPDPRTVFRHPFLLPPQR